MIIMEPTTNILNSNEISESLDDTRGSKEIDDFDDDFLGDEKTRKPKGKKIKKMRATYDR
jgi:hypothetical protein